MHAGQENNDIYDKVHCSLLHLTTSVLLNECTLRGLLHAAQATDNSDADGLGLAATRPRVLGGLAESGLAAAQAMVRIANVSHIWHLAVVPEL